MSTEPTLLDRVNLVLARELKALRRSRPGEFGNPDIQEECFYLYSNGVLTRTVSSLERFARQIGVR